MPELPESRFFTPNRADRPKSEEESCESAGSWLGHMGDGRPVVCEMALVMGFPCWFFYFDPTGIETASVDELQQLLQGVRFSWYTSDSSAHPRWLPLDRALDMTATTQCAGVSAKLMKDADGRAVWEVQETEPPLND